MAKHNRLICHMPKGNLTREEQIRGSVPTSSEKTKPRPPKRRKPW